MKIYLKQNVFDAALDRVRFVFDEFEEVLISHSGGKDSEVVLQLALIVAREKKRLPLKVLFIDQEAEWNSTIERIRAIAAMPEVEMLWLQVPIKLFNATSRDEEWLYCWEEGAEWIREKEEISIKENIYGTDRFKNLFKAFINTTYPADRKVACLGGVRCEESPVRFLGCTHAATYKWVTWGKKLNKENTHFTFYPIYDWSFTDVWKAIHTNNWPYNRHYDYLYMYGEPIGKMRVSNVHHETAVHSLFHLQEIDPALYNALTKRLRGIDTAGKFRDDFFVYELPYMFADWREYRDYLLERIAAPERREIFRRKFLRTEKVFKNTPYYERLLKEHVNCLITNDYHFTKLENFVKKPGLSKKHLRQAGFLIEDDEPLTVELPPVEERENQTGIVIARSNFETCLHPEERCKAFGELEKNLEGRHFEVSVDTEMHNHFRGLRKAWQKAYDLGRPYCLVIEEDALLAPEFFRSLAAAMDLLADPKVSVLQLGAMSSKFPEFLEKGFTAVRRNWLAWHWAVLIPRGTVADILELAGKIPEPKFFDDAITAFLKATKTYAAIPLPNLVSQKLPDQPARRQNLKRLFGRERSSSCLADSVYRYNGKFTRERK